MTLPRGDLRKRTESFQTHSRLKARPRLLLRLKEREMILPHPTSPLRHLKPSLSKPFNPLLEWDLVAVVGYMMDSLSVLIKEFLEDGWAGNGLDDFVDHVGTDFGEADA